MSDFVTAAEKGSKKAMLSLLNATKDKAYGLALLLLDDEETAGKIVSEVLSTAFDKITVKGLYSDEVFAKYIQVETATAAAAKLFGNSQKTFRVSRSDAALPETEATLFEGDIEEGIKELKTALEQLSAAEKFVFLLKSSGMSFADISKVIVQREAAAVYFYSEALKKLSGEINLSTVEDLVSKRISSKILPTENEAEARAVIKARARFELPSKRAMTAIISGVCFLALAVMAFFLLKDIYLDKKSAEEAQEGYHVAAALDEDKTYYADIKIKDYGTITVKLDQKSAPNTAANFVELAEKGYYNGLTFHRIMEGFMMQGGCPLGNGTGDPGYSIRGEFSANGFEENTLTHTAGTISMARGNDYNSAGSQFFIVHEDSTHLDGNYAAFGYVTEGLEIVDKICTEAEPTDPNGTISADAQPVIESITIRSE